jgi:hypothetical protein
MQIKYVGILRALIIVSLSVVTVMGGFSHTQSASDGNLDFVLTCSSSYLIS